ncbi:carbonic anhydrase [Halobacillus andaensis]|uniref:Carbonic anhydrase n=1 Tax=Halobacillus andaensis TaxID=1176239 RepID=A0A917B6H6_HALAA|nr:carbonic anhydrase family protein [Halobacillus andaensis]MBP2006448.1 carbonic anhydrase [Halobacillus andaensis]GGF27470.1 carbonic anhydrase [Halobacillus andaensis]
MPAKLLAYPVFAALIGFTIGGCQEQTRETGAPEEEQNDSERNEEAVEWSYEGGTGPDHWGELDDAYAACANGKEQSPVNIDSAQVEEDEEKYDVEVNYQSSSFSLANNGHSIQANSAASENHLVINDEEYELAQFHFHQPSEHLVNEQRYEMELHLVHETENGDAAVLGVMIEEGEENNTLSDLWDQLPSEETEEDVNIEEPVDLQALLPEDQTTFQYEGSLTTPPCTEEVKWMLFEEPIEMSEDQIQDFKKIYHENHRPEQSLEDREIIKN